jgi:hypothetical protein
VEQEWDKITERRGRESQVEVWQQFLENLEKLGLQVDNPE